MTEQDTQNTLTFADIIVRDTERFRPSITRYPDGDVEIRWPRPVNFTRLVESSDLDMELFHKTSRYVGLHIPASIASEKGGGQ